jgi:flagellar motor switch protein FliN/FliY
MSDTVKLPPRLAGIPVHLKVLLGRTKLSLEQVAHLQRGTTVLLDTTLDDPVSGYVGDMEMVSGRVYALHGRFAVRVERVLTRAVDVDAE